MSIKIIDFFLLNKICFIILKYLFLIEKHSYFFVFFHTLYQSFYHKEYIHASSKTFDWYLHIGICEFHYKIYGFFLSHFYVKIHWFRRHGIISTHTSFIYIIMEHNSRRIYHNHLPTHCR